jgi:hypothetical protein
MGEGDVGPSLRDLGRSEDALADLIGRTMPFDAPGTCAGDCARNVARYILATFVGAVACTEVTPAARGLRLLTRREYRNTVHDLFGPLDGGAACDPVTFSYDPQAQTPKSVHVAGSFNNWAATIAAGGWAMTYSAASKRWSTTHALAAGQYQYKLVIDESQWIADPADPQTAPDGYGGTNSLLTVACPTGGGAAPDPTADFPPEVRPQGFAFDDNGPARPVSDVHVEQYQAAAATLAAAATQHLDALVGCDWRADAGGCAADFVARFGQRAFRRPLTDAEQQRYVALIGGQQDFAAGVTLAVRAMLGSPYFLYRSELGALQPDGSYRLTPYEVASALSYLFWATMPDQARFDAAAAGRLDSRDGIEEQARRLLADPRARAVVGVFAEQWLGAENVSTVDKRDALFPGFDAGLREALRDETRRFVESVVFDSSHSYGELVQADYSFANGAVAAFYGWPGVSGDGWAKVPLADGQRAGVLGEASVLAATAHSDQTSPIRRGLFVRRALLCQEFPAPPPNAGGLPPVDPNATTRERFAQHAANPSCASCHKYIDPVGFGFERFDPIGKLRDTENGKPIDSSGDMNDVEGFGTDTHAPFGSLAELGAALAASQTAKRCFARQLFRFARGYHEEDADRCAIDALVRRFADSGWDIRELMVGIAASPDFVVRRQGGPDDPHR